MLLLPAKIEAFEDLEEEITDISCGGQHSLFLTSEFEIISCGNNASGQCGFDSSECS